MKRYILGLAQLAVGILILFTMAHVIDQKSLSPIIFFGLLSLFAVGPLFIVYGFAKEKTLPLILKCYAVLQTILFLFPAAYLFYVGKTCNGSTCGVTVIFIPPLMFVIAFVGVALITLSAKIAERLK